MSDTQNIHGKDVSADPTKWSDDEVVWLFQWDMPEINDAVREQAASRGLDLPGMPTLTTQNPGVAEPGRPCPTCGQVVPDPAAADDTEVQVESAYSGWTNDELRTELDNRGIEYASGDRKAELTQLLVADDEAQG